MGLNSVKPDSKRQRTASELSSSPSRGQSPGGDSDADDKKQKPRGAAARSQRDKEVRERERERADAASKRKGRADRRRADGGFESCRPFDLMLTQPESEPPTEAPNNNATNNLRPSTAPSDIEPATSQPPDTPLLAPSNLKGHKKGLGKGKSNRGKNQYTRDSTQTPLDADTPLPNGDTGRRSRRGHDETSPARNGRSGENTDGGSGKDGGDGEGHTRPSSAKEAPGSGGGGHGKGRGRGMNLQKTSMNEMRRKVHTMLNYVSQAQIDMATKKSLQVAVETALEVSGNGEHVKETEKEKENVDKNAEKKDVPDLDGSDSKGTGSAASVKDFSIGKTIEEFGGMNMGEMMNLLSTRLVLWQQEYGKHGEK